MTKHLWSLAAVAACLASATPAAAQYDSPFAGFYVGGNLGVTWGDTETDLEVEPGSGAVVIPPGDVASLNTPIGSDDDNETGFTGGIEAGYNYVSGNMLLGIETDFGVFDISESRSRTFQSPLLIAPPVTYTVSQEVGADWIWTLRPRIGYASDQWLLFGSAGIAVTDAKVDARYVDTRVPAGVANFSTSETKVGFAGGLGAAYAMSPNWSVKGEWLYVDFGDVSGTAVSNNGFVAITSSGEVSANLLRVGVDYRF